MKAAQGNAEIKAFKRVFFSPSQEKYLPTLLFLIKIFRQRTGLVRNRMGITSNLNRFVKSFCEHEQYCFGRTAAHAGNMGLKEIAGEVVNQTFVHSINCCGRLTVHTIKPPLL